LAIKITRVAGVEGQSLLIPTTREINSRITAKLEELESRTAPTLHASTKKTYGVGTSTNYGHLRITNDIENVSEDIAILPSAVKQQLLILESELTNAISDKTYFGSYWFARTKQETSLSDPLYSPAALAATLGVTTGNMSLVDFIDNKIYTAVYSAISWGESALELGVPDNGTVIGVTGYFLDILENTEILKLSGRAVYSETKQRWDIYPDKQGGIDNYTLTKNESGLDSIANYYIRDLTNDVDNYDPEDATARSYFEWLTSFYRKIKGLHSLVSSKLDKSTTASTLYGLDALGEQSNITYTKTTTADAIVQREDDGNIAVPAVQTAEGQAISGTTFNTHTTDAVLHKTETDTQKLGIVFLPTELAPGETEFYLSQTGVYKAIQHQSLEDYATKLYAEGYADSVTEIATTLKKGTVLSSVADDKVLVEAGGEMTVTSLNIYKLYQEENDLIVFCGGNASGQLIEGAGAY
jgi:hypothetical protein